MNVPRPSILVALLLALPACDSTEPETSLVVSASSDRVGVATLVPLELTASMDRGAAGRTVRWVATDGSFSSTASVLTAEATVAVDGASRTYWVPPTKPGPVWVEARVLDGQATTGAIGRLTIDVYGVPEIQITNAPSEIGRGEQAVITVRAPPEWAGHAVEVRAPSASLVSVGPAKENRDRGDVVEPLLDQTGQADVVLKAADGQTEIRFVASLYGTRSQRFIRVTAP